MADTSNSGFTILVSRQQTRFQHEETFNSKEIDIQGLDITVTSAQHSVTPEPSATGDRSGSRRRKNKTEAVQSKDILVGAHLRLKQGVRYGLLGRNGSGKSTLLTAIAERLIPGMASASLTVSSMSQVVEEAEGEGQGKTALEFVLEGDGRKKAVMRELGELEAAAEQGPVAQLAAYRRIRYSRLQDRLKDMQKNANLRSGSRGFRARQGLSSFEHVVEEARLRTLSDFKELDPTRESEETQSASGLLLDLQTQAEILQSPAHQSLAVRILLGLGFTSPQLSHPYALLSGGFKTRCHLTTALLYPSSLLLLDEPTNYLDLSAILYLESHLVTALPPSTTLLLVSHDRSFLNNVCSELVILQHRDRSLSYFPGPLSAYESNRAARRQYMARMAAAIERQRDHIQATIDNNMREGLRTGNTSRLRQAVSRQKKLSERHGMQVNEKGFRFKLSRDQGCLGGSSGGLRPVAVVERDEKEVVWEIPRAGELRFPGGLVTLEGVSFTYGGGETVLEGVELVVHMGDRIAIVGMNGAGKSTLVRLLTGEATPGVGRGTVSMHPRLKMGYYSQHAVERLRGEAGVAAEKGEHPLTALGVLAGDTAGAMSEAEMRGLLGSFGLSGKAASDVPVGRLSGGQLVRLALVRIVWDHPHLLILDEISTHLDFDSVNALKEALVDYDGAVVLVSHDRYLVRWVVEGGDGECSDDEEIGSETERRGDVYLLHDKSLRKLEGGVDELEEELYVRLESTRILQESQTSK